MDIIGDKNKPIAGVNDRSLVAKALLVTLFLTTIYTIMVGQTPENSYKGKRVLGIGASKNVLAKLSKSISNEGLILQWTTDYEDVELVVEQFNASDYDVIAFGRGVSADSKTWLKERFKSQHADILFVDGLAPITNLLIDQIKLALKPETNLAVSVDKLGNGDVAIRTNKQATIVGKFYRLNWLYQRQEVILFERKFHTEAKIVQIPKKTGARFLVLMQDDMVLEIVSL